MLCYTTLSDFSLLFVRRLFMETYRNVYGIFTFSFSAINTQGVFLSYYSCYAYFVAVTLHFIFLLLCLGIEN